MRGRRSGWRPEPGVVVVVVDVDDGVEARPQLRVRAQPPLVATVERPAASSRAATPGRAGARGRPGRGSAYSAGSASPACRYSRTSLPSPRSACARGADAADGVSVGVLVRRDQHAVGRRNRGDHVVEVAVQMGIRHVPTSSSRSDPRSGTTESRNSFMRRRGRRSHHTGRSAGEYVSDVVSAQRSLQHAAGAFQRPQRACAALLEPSTLT